MDTNEVESVADALAAVKAVIDDFWATLDADPDLDEDDRAKITQLVEDAGEDVDEARQLVARSNAEKD